MIFTLITNIWCSIYWYGKWNWSPGVSNPALEGLPSWFRCVWLGFMLRYSSIPGAGLTTPTPILTCAVISWTGVVFRTYADQPQHWNHLPKVLVPQHSSYVLRRELHKTSVSVLRSEIIWHSDISSRSYKSCKFSHGASMDWICCSSTSHKYSIRLRFG